MNLLPQIPSATFFFLYFWSIVWKGIALWRASKLNQRNWFIAILVLNTFGIVELVYLFYFAKDKLTLGELKKSVKSIINFDKSRKSPSK